MSGTAAPIDVMEEPTLWFALFDRQTRRVRGVCSAGGPNARLMMAMQETAEVGAADCPEGMEASSMLYTDAGLFEQWIAPFDAKRERAAARGRVDSLATALQAAVSGGRGEIHAAKLIQAERVLSGDPVSPAEVPLIAAEAELDGVSLFDVAASVAINAYEAGNQIAVIEQRRLIALRAIEAAQGQTDIAAAEAAFANADKTGS